MNSWLFDSLILLGYFAGIIGIGLAAARRQSSFTDYALGGRKMPWWAVLASILAAEISAATFLGAPGEGYALRNFTYAQLAIGTILARVLVSWIFIKPYYAYNVVSIYEFLEKRFGPQSRQAASAVFLITRALASGTRLYVAAIVLVLGWEMISGAKASPEAELAIYIVALLVLVLLTAVYTVAGGIKAVVWTDVIQAVVMFSGLGFVLWHLFQSIPGGLPAIHEKLNQPSDLTFWNFGPMVSGDLGATIKGILESDYTIWTAFLAATFVTMATHGTDQDMVQRMLTAKNPARSRLALVGSGLADIPIVLAFLGIGILLYLHYQQAPDPNLPTRNAHIFAYYILHELPPGFRGLLIAGIFATAMGSLSTALNALATSWVRDWYEPFFCLTLSEPELPPRRPLGHRHFFDHPRWDWGDDRVGCHPEPNFSNPAHRSRNLWLYLRIAPRRFSFGCPDQDPWIRQGKSDCHGRRFHRCRDSFWFTLRRTETLRPAAPAPPGVASPHRISMAHHFRNNRNLCGGYFFSDEATSKELNARFIK